ncbi:hypothetical protein LCGC14_1283420 [marine sediment metagenome]|uniref:Uncharacterized protein n=1 Tax=marine sediment metagenome TaxID=412755 RepID=A0A0F9NB64_9ZZZZ
MKTRTELKIATVIWGLMLIAIFLLIIMLFTKPDGTPASAYTDEGSQAGAILPSMFDIQRELVRRGYKIKIDGKIGRKTLEAWDDALCERYFVGDMEILK